ncbi:hypothetical protein [Flavobacterium anhuiense]|uniref:hypothetical protein n=1 Tax=Flavobacterium anhuiense TaxID=459526 RepID=UPI00118399F3|nr:hypothetical protein [Flavobacterium anhuiense]
MNINSNETEALLSFAEEMASLGYRYAAHPVNLPADSGNTAFFRTPMAAEDHCLVGANDIDHFKSVPIDSLITGLTTVMQSGIDLYSNEKLDLTEFVRLAGENKELQENNLNTNIMNETNLKYLKDQLKYTGFGETFDTELKENMLKGDKDFKIMHTGIMNNGVPNKDAVTVELNFKKSDQTDMYFFNSYHVNLQKEENKPALEQTFYINNDGTSITLKEAYNLMEGRSVNKDLKTKEGESYNSWLKFDFKQTDNSGNFKISHYHQNYGYDLEASLEKHSIKELNTPKYKEDLMNSLKKGNLQSVTFVVGGVESKMFVEANPQFKTLNVYDGNLQRINHRESKEEKKSEGEKTSEKQSEAAEENSEAPSANKPKKRKQQSNSV